MEKISKKVVAIIGRPNVGKSTFFNRMVGKRVAIETEIAGATRDRLFGEVSWCGTTFDLIDVAGVETGSKSELTKSMQDGVNLVIENADLVLFLVDWNDKNNEMDKNVARMLKKTGKKVILVVNKADNVKRQEDLEEFKRLGYQNPVPVSAISGKSTGDLLDVIVKELGTNTIPPKSKVFDIDLAIIGRPNVGKSTLLNTIIGEKRAIVSSEAGTTRDIIDVEFFHKGKKFLISDTAGIRRPGKISKDTIESFSVIRTYQALKDCDAAILVIDAQEGLVSLDTNILGKAKEWGKSIVLAINKIDLVPGDKDEYMGKMIWKLQKELNFVPWLPIVFISAEQDENLNALLSQVVNAFEARQTIIPQEELDAILANAKESNFQVFNVKSLKQKKANPPIFEITFPAKAKPHFTQIRYIENKIRDVYPMNGTPVFLDNIVLGKKYKK